MQREGLVPEMVGPGERLQMEIGSRQPSIRGLNYALDSLVFGIREQHPDFGAFEFYKRIADSVTGRLPSEVQQRALEAISSSDPIVSAMGKKAAVLLNLKTVFSAVDCYLGTNQDENDEIVQAALKHISENLSKLNPRLEVPQQFHDFAKQAAAQYVATREGMPIGWALKGKHDRVKDLIGKLMEENSLGVSWGQIGSLASEINQEIGVDLEAVVRYIRLQNALIIESTEAEHETVHRQAIVDRFLPEAIEDALKSLPVERRRVLELRFGFEDGREWTLAEIGSELGKGRGSREKMREWEARGLRDLRGYRARELNGFLDEDSGGYIKYCQDIWRFGTVYDSAHRFSQSRREARFLTAERKLTAWLMGEYQRKFPLKANASTLEINQWQERYSDFKDYRDAWPLWLNMFAEVNGL